MPPTSVSRELASTGIEGLDDVLRGGLPTRRIYLVTGNPGTGKTTLGLQFLMEGVKRGEKTLYVTLSETEEELREVAQSHGWNLEGIVLHQLGTLEEMQNAQQQNTLFHPAEVELNETVSRVLAVVEEVHPSRIVFDSLSEMRLLAQDSLRYRRQILSLKQHFSQSRSTVLFLDDNTSSAADGDLQLQSLAHGVLSLEKISPEFGCARRRIEVVKLRGVDFRSGKHDCVIEHEGVRVFPRLIAAEHKARFQVGQVTSGVPEIDALVGGGMERGTSTVMLGPAGSGKSTMATQFVKAATSRGEHVAIFNFDENTGTFFERTRSVGLDLRQEDQAGLLKVRQVDPGELSPGELTHAVRRAVTVDKARMVVIDSLNGYLMAMPEERFLVIQMHELLSFLSQQGVVTFLIVAQHGLVGNMQTPIDVTYLADSVVLFRFFESEGKVRKAVSVLKKRVSAHEDAIRELRITSQGLRVGEPLTNLRGVLSGTPVFAGRSQTLIGNPT